MWKVITFIVLVAVVFIVSPGALAQNGLSPIEELGKFLYFDENLSTPPGMSCATCHAPEVGFTGPVSDINLETSVYPGVVFTRFGNRKPPTAAYGGDSPNLYYDGELFVGGMFWDGRATGWELEDPLAEQARGPFLNPLEMNNPTKQSVCIKVAFSEYAGLFETVWGEPPMFKRKADIEWTYDHIALAIAAFEASAKVNPFTSKFDYYLKNEATLTPQEAEGMALFMAEDKGNCAACHTMSLNPTEISYFTDFSYDNLGIPKFPGNPFYTMPRIWNPAGEDWIDPGLGGFLEGLVGNADWKNLPTVDQTIAEMTDEELSNHAAENYGKHKVPTLRNVDLRPNGGFIKGYGHNGYFKSLEEITHFYNTRDLPGAGWDGIPWPAPEVSATVNTDELGNLGLTAAEETAIVAFMKTLSDGYDASNSMVMSQPKSGTAGLLVTGPNPFNPETNFLYTVSEPGNIKIEVFNITGQRMATLVNDWKPAGDYPLKWYAAQYPSGIYFVRLSTSHDVLIKKVSLIK